MKYLSKLIKKYPRQTILLTAIILTGIFFRSYHLVGRFEFAHDGDLYSWIAKDIIVDHHFRLIGQLTSAPGIFIGPLFYYSLVPFFLLFNMDPVGGNFLTLILSVVTLISFFYIFTKLFNYKVGMVITFLQAVLLFHVNFDRSVVPTTPTHLWAVWYFYCLVQISRRKFSASLPVLGALIGLIWHIHVALAPAFLSLPLAFYFAKKLPSKRQILHFFMAFAIISLPFLLFEVRHNFSQTKSLILNFSEDHYGGKGYGKFIRVLEMIAKNTTNLFFLPAKTGHNFQLFFGLLIFASAVYLWLKKIISLPVITMSLVWILGMIIFFTFSTTPISEYYFANFETILLAVAALLLVHIYDSFSWGKYPVYLILSVALVFNLSHLLQWGDTPVGYLSRKAAVDFIRSDMDQNSYPCISLNHIAITGENVGYRYFLWKNNVKVVSNNPLVPNYQIVMPAGLSNEVTFKNGLIGVIPPKDFTNTPELKVICETQINRNLEDSVFGFVK